MPVPTYVEHEKNIWVAAGDGDLARVKELIEEDSMSPNAPDPSTYTPMHAAASYGRLEVLEYLISRGGDVNVTDSDGDTPIYTVETLETARFLVEHGATVEHRNEEGLTPAEHLTEDFPEVSQYLDSLTSTSTATTASTPDRRRPSDDNTVSQHSQDVASERMTSSLMESVGEVMRRAEAEGRDGEDEIRGLVERMVLEGMSTGYEMGGANREDDLPDQGDMKRARQDD